MRFFTTGESLVVDCSLWIRCFQVFNVDGLIASYLVSNACIWHLHHVVGGSTTHSEFVGNAATSPKLFDGGGKTSLNASIPKGCTTGPFATLPTRVTF